MFIQIVNDSQDQLILDGISCSPDLSKEIDTIARHISLTKCHDCNCLDSKCACDMIYSCFNVFKFFDALDSFSSCKVIVKSETSTTEFSCLTSQACFLAISHCLFKSECPQFSSYRNMFQMYHPLFTPYHMIHMFTSFILMHLIVTGVPVSLDTLKSKITEVNEQMKERLRLIHANARKFFAGETLGNVFQMLFSANHLSSHLIDKVIREMTGTPGRRDPDPA